jgi:hypothetical protein
MAARTLRWWIVDTFTPTGNAGRARVSGERFPNVMGKLAVAATVPIPDVLGPKAPRSVDLSFRRPRDFRVGDVIEAVDVLRRLQATADALAKDRSSTLDSALTSVRAIVGDGPLCALLEETTAVPAAEPPTSSTSEISARPAEASPPNDERSPAPRGAAEPSSDDGGLDAIFAKAALPSVSKTQAASVVREAKSSVAAFIDAVMQDSRTTRVSRDPGREPAAKTIAQTVQAIACHILGQPPIADLERAWRGLRMVVSASRGHDALAIELLDADPSSVADDLRRAWPTSTQERPHGVFVGSWCSDPQALVALAATAADLGRPVVVSVSAELAGLLAEGRDLEPGPSWPAAGDVPGAQWLCTVANPIALASEDIADAAPRLVWGAPAIALAALVAGRVDRDRPVPDVGGPTDALVAPAAHDVELRPGEVRTLGTRSHASIEHQQAAIRHGIVLLGGPVGSDHVVVLSTPMFGGGSLTARMREAMR